MFRMLSRVECDLLGRRKWETVLTFLFIFYFIFLLSFGVEEDPREHSYTILRRPLYYDDGIMNSDMDIDDSEFAGSFGSSLLSRREDTVDLENLISGLRRETTTGRDFPRERNATSSKQADIERLRRIWVAERVAPEVLQFEGDLIDRIMARVRNQVRPTPHKYQMQPC